MPSSARAGAATPSCARSRAATATRARRPSKRSQGRTTPEPFSLGEALALFEALHKARGPVAKTELLQARLQKLSPLEAQYVVKILTGDLRIGLREGLVEEAIARAFEARSMN